MSSFTSSTIQVNHFSEKSFPFSTKATSCFQKMHSFNINQSKQTQKKIQDTTKKALKFYDSSPNECDLY